MDQQLGDIAEPGYVSCMFCTARCFKLHGTTSHGAGCAAASTSSRELMVLQPGASKERSSGRRHRAPFFVKTVKITTVRRKNCELHLPAFFFKDYGDRFQKFVLLQGPSGQVWPVNLCVSCGSTTGRPTVRFSRGWKEFANDHRLELGDKLIFTLASFSRFSVQVFDPLGRKKPTSSTAVSGWSFRREEEDEKLDELPGSSASRPQEKKSIFVNWQNKVVRESSLGSSSAKGQASRLAMLCRHLKKAPENKRSSSLVAKLRSQSLPLTLLGHKWSNRGTASSDEVTQADDVATNLLEWEPLETASPSQLWPLALKSSHSSKAGSQGATVLSITSTPSSPPREGDQAEGDVEEDPFQAYWKLHNKRSAISETVAPWPAAETPQTLNVRPISTLELAPKAIDTPPSPTLISISHCLKPLSRSEVVLPQPCNVQSSVSQELLGFANSYMKQDSVRPEKFVSEAEKSIPASNVQSSVTQGLLGLSNSSKQASVRREKLLPQRNFEEERIVSAPSSHSELKIKTPTPSRSDLSLAYFLHQPRPTAQIQRAHEDGQHNAEASGEFSRLQKPPVSAQKSQAPDSVRIKPSLATSKENIPPGGPLVVYNSSVRDDELALPCKRSGTSMLPQEKKSRPLGLSQAVSSSRRDMVDKFHLDSSSKKMNSRVVISEDDHLKVRKVMNLGAGALNSLLGSASTPQATKVVSGNRCDLVELDDIASDDDDDEDWSDS